ncbi:MAG: hypothetical protein QF554_00670 [Dehalococcoidia bacterium]|jgi:hypothetical protein|nr:hypothetical protein [Dehalococcoidia bacterium]
MGDNLGIARDLNGMRVRIAFPLPQNRDAKGIVGTAREIGQAELPVFAVDPIGPIKDRNIRQRQFQEAELRLLL